MIGEHVQIYQGVTLGALSTHGGQSLKNVKSCLLYTSHITQKVNKSLNVLLIQSKIVIKVLLMNLIYLSILLQNLKLLRKISKIKSVKNMPQVVGNI